MMRLLRRIAALFRPAVEQYDDPEFGSLSREGGGDWHGEIPLTHAPTGARSMSLLIGSGEGRPTDEQRVLFRKILSRYAELWPRVAEALANDHPKHKTVEAVSRHVDEPCLCLDPIRVSRPIHWSLQYTFDDASEGDLGYFVDLCDWEIEGVFAVD